MNSSTQDYERFRSHFSNSLRRLCEERSSINQVCKDLGINRQQFAKYLSGQNLPSLFVAQRIIDYFKASPDDLFLYSGVEDSAAAIEESILETSNAVTEGTYLECFASHESPETHCGISVWHFRSGETRATCRSIMPRAVPGPNLNAYALHTYDGMVRNFGDMPMLFSREKDSDESLTIYLKPSAVGPKDYFAMRVQNIHDCISSVPSMFRYLGVNVAFSKIILEDCGIFAVPELSERSAAAWRALQYHVSTSKMSMLVRP